MLRQVIALFLAQSIAILIFCCGFFPRKNAFEDSPDFSLVPFIEVESRPIFEKLVLIVIDALRSDFVFEKSISNFTFMHSLLNSGEAWGYTAYSNPPTVTLPRLKGITTGSTPNFLDALLNVAEDASSSGLKEQDSLLNQFIKKGKRIRFFGDDTWLKLFPLDFFQEYEGTNSFFVTDFDQVDLNVTRHVPHQLETQNEWDVLILHYLGLDHIGHRDGARSVFMPGKHAEMDSIVRNIYENMEEKTLICVIGDHGMNDAGNHGGSSPGETSSALVMISKKLKRFELPLAQQVTNLPIAERSLESEVNYEYLTKIQQVDLVPTLAALFNIPIPRNNVGVIIPDFLQLLDSNPIIKVKENFNQLTSVLGYGLQNGDHYSVETLIEKMREVQDILTKSSTNYKYNMIFMGICLLGLVTGITLWYGISVMHIGKSSLITVIISLLIGISTFSSSFVEEEHQIWWWIITGILFLSQISLRRAFKLHLICLVCARLIRGWNNSGQKHIYDNTIFELLKINSNIHWYLTTLTIFSVGLKDSFKDPLSFILLFPLCALCGTYKVGWALANREIVPFWMQRIALKSCSYFAKPDTTDREIIDKALIPMAQLFFKYFICCMIIKVSARKLKASRTNLFSLFSILLMFQSPSANIPLFFVFEILRSTLSHLFTEYYCCNVYYISLSSLLLQYFTFFQFGGTNSIATIDLTNAYNGVSKNYNIYVVGLMMLVSNFAPTIYWSLYKSTIPPPNGSKWVCYSEEKIPFLIFNCIVGFFLIIACYIFRFHLFIWSVFSPKLCYFSVWSIFMNILIGCGLEPIIWAMET